MLNTTITTITVPALPLLSSTTARCSSFQNNITIVTYFLFSNYDQQQFPGSTAMSSFSPSAPSAAYSHMHMSQVRFITLL